jgi:hypothetical protein
MLNVIMLHDEMIRGCCRIVIILLVVTLYACAGTPYQPYDGQLGYQEERFDTYRVITYYATDTTPWSDIELLIEQRVQEWQNSEPGAQFSLVRQHRSAIPVFVKRQHPAQYTAMTHLDGQWVLLTHERIDLLLPAWVRVYRREYDRNDE